ncbi:MAG: hypothetical protein MI923_16270 [Phycisphaerales bacterium]|nr:hypothetical protein [Phycisphaerales bacterium]
MPRKWLTDVLLSIQDWIQWQVMDGADATSSAPDIFTTTLELPEDSSVKRKIVVTDAATESNKGRYVIAEWVDANNFRVTKIEDNGWTGWETTGEALTYHLETEIAAYARRLDFSVPWKTRDVPKKTASDLPLLMMSPAAGSHTVSQHSNTELGLDLNLQFELWTPGQDLTLVTDFYSMVVDRLLAGRVFNEPPVKRPFRIPDATTGYQRAELSDLQIEQNRIIEENTVVNVEHVAKFAMRCLILRQGPQSGLPLSGGGAPIF